MYVRKAGAALFNCEHWGCIWKCGDRSRRFAVRQPQLPRLRSRQGKAAIAIAALQKPREHAFVPPLVRRSSFALILILILASCAAPPRKVVDDGVFRAVILGDSVAHGAGDESGRAIAGRVDDELARLHIRSAPTINLGVDGARTSVVRRLLEKANAKSALRSADVVILSIGGNDLYGDSIARLLAGLWPGHQRARVLIRVARVVSDIQHINANAHIYVIGLYNPYRHSSLAAFLDRQVNLWDAGLITRFASMRRVTVIRVCDLLDRDDRISTLDRFHPGTNGYAAIAARIAAAF